MLNENAKKWIAALRSGKYKQGKHVLSAQNGKDCCLGVACKLYLQEHPEMEVAERVISLVELKRPIPCISYGGETEVLPVAVQNWLGLKNGDGGYGPCETEALAGLNDEGKSFTRIADIIESEPENLFVKECNYLQ
jgi:hypothetical protein